jgi:hypothetical protein
MISAAQTKFSVQSQSVACLFAHLKIFRKIASEFCNNVACCTVSMTSFPRFSTSFSLIPWPKSIDLDAFAIMRKIYNYSALASGMQSQRVGCSSLYSLQHLEPAHSVCHSPLHVPFIT